MTEPFPLFPAGAAGPSFGAPSVRPFAIPTTTLLVGPDKIKFVLDSQLFVDACQYVRHDMATNRFSMKRMTGQVQMPMEDPETVEYFVDWLKGGHKLDYPINKVRDKEPYELTLYMNLWLFGDRWAIIGIQNYVIRQMNVWKADDQNFAEKLVLLIDKDASFHLQFEKEDNKLAHWLMDVVIWDKKFEGGFGKVAAGDFDEKFLKAVNRRKSYVLASGATTDPTVEIKSYFVEEVTGIDIPSNMRGRAGSQSWRAPIDPSKIPRGRLVAQNYWQLDTFGDKGPAKMYPEKRDWKDHTAMVLHRSYFR